LGQAFAPEGAEALPAVPAAHLPEHTPNEATAKEILSGLGLSIAREAVCSSVDAALEAAESLGYPVVMKILSPDILHKTEIGGVLTSVGDADAVRAAYETLMSRARTARPDARLDGVLVA